MKLLYCIPALYNAGGMERVLTEKVNYLANLPNYNIHIVTTDHKKDLDVRFSLDNRIKITHLDIDFVGHYNENLIKKYFLHKKKIHIYKKKLEEIIVCYGIDICISLCGKEIDFLAKINAKCKKIAEIHFPLNNRSQFLMARHTSILWKLLGSIRTFQLKKSVKKLDKFVVLTKEDKRQWNKYSSNVILIRNPNPFKTNYISTLSQSKAISIGRLEPEKGYDMLIDAWSIVVQNHPNWIFEIYGEGGCRSELEERILRKNLAKNFKLVGLTSDVQSKYLESSFFAMSSLYEGLPMVLIEAISCGLPVVSFDCDFGPREIIDDKINGLLVEPNNVNLLADKICFLIENVELRKKMGINAQIKSNEFSIDKIMEKWINLFSSLTSPNNNDK